MTTKYAYKAACTLLRHGADMDANMDEHGRDHPPKLVRFGDEPLRLGLDAHLTVSGSETFDRCFTQRYLVDTGAAYSDVDERAARELGLRPAPRHGAMTLYGNAATDVPTLYEAYVRFPNGAVVKTTLDARRADSPVPPVLGARDMRAVMATVTP